MSHAAPNFALYELETVLQIADHYIGGAKSGRAMESFLNALRIHFCVESVAIVHLETNQPASLVAYASKRRTDNEVLIFRDRLASLTCIPQYSHIPIVKSCDDALISIRRIHESLACALIIRSPVKPFGKKMALSLRMIHSLIEPHLASVLRKQQPVDASPPRVQQVRDGLLDGLSDKQIALRLGISHHTVHVHVKRLYKLSGVHSRAELLSGYLQRASNIGGTPTLSSHEVPNNNFQKANQNFTTATCY